MNNSKKVTCPKCGGSGTEETRETTEIVDGAVRKSSHIHTCPRCHGERKIDKRGHGITTEYRRKKGESVWHFCKNCPGWPDEVDGYDVRLDEQVPSDVDRQCEEIEEDGNCDMEIRGKPN